MKFCIRLLIVLFITNWTHAQQQLIFESAGSYNSTSLPRKLPNAFFYGGYLDSSFLAETYASLPNRNSFGLQMQANLLYQSKKALSQDPKKWASAWNWQFGAGLENYTGIQFSNASFGFVFLGAAPFIGDTLDFSHTKIQSISFSKVGLGLYHPESKSSVQLNLVGVHQQFSANINQASWFQDPIQDSIFLQLNANARYATNSLSALGLALDLDYRFASETDHDPMVFQLKIQNLGLAYQITPLQQLQFKGSYAYGAYDLQTLQQFQLVSNLDSALSALNFQRSSLSSWTLLPASIQLAKLVNNDSTIRVQAYYGAHFMLRQTYTPMFFAGAHFFVTKKWQTGIGAAYGGFGGLRAQTYSAFSFNKYQIFLRTDNLTFRNGASIYLQVKCDL
ncbi:MAG: hypothetical protein RL078_1820 [Bacteroidota bacterium]|jgi:hypothetical protein